MIKLGDVVVPRTNRSRCKTRMKSEWWCGDYGELSESVGIVRCIHNYGGFTLYGCVWYEFRWGSGHYCGAGLPDNAWSLCDGCLDLADTRRENELIRLTLAGEFKADSISDYRKHPGRIAGEKEIE